MIFKDFRSRAVMLGPIDRGLFSFMIFMHASSGWRVPSSVVSVAGRQSLGSGCASGFFSNQSLGISVDQRYVLRESEGKPLHDGIEVLCPLCPLTAHAAGGCPSWMWARVLGLTEHRRVITVRLVIIVSGSLSPWCGRMLSPMGRRNECGSTQQDRPFSS